MELLGQAAEEQRRQQAFQMQAINYRNTCAMNNLGSLLAHGAVDSETSQESKVRTIDIAVNLAEQLMVRLGLIPETCYFKTPEEMKAEKEGTVNNAESH